MYCAQINVAQRAISPHTRAPKGSTRASGHENCGKKNIQDKIFWPIMAENTACTVVVPFNIRNLESKSF